jgi:hypothetical protein
MSGVSSLPEELPFLFVAGLRAAIKEEQEAPRRENVIDLLRQVRTTGEFDEADRLQVELLEPNFADRYTRTPERIRKRADRLLREYRRQRPGNHGRGAGRYFVRPDGIAASTLCALMISVKFRWPPVTNGQAQDASEELWAAAGGDIRRRGGTHNRSDGFWRDHLREAQRFRGSNLSRRIELAVSCFV